MLGQTWLSSFRSTLPWGSVPHPWVLTLQKFCSVKAREGFNVFHHKSSHRPWDQTCLYLGDLKFGVCFLQRCYSSCTINSEKESFQIVVAKRYRGNTNVLLCDAIEATHTIQDTNQTTSRILILRMKLPTVAIRFKWLEQFRYTGKKPETQSKQSQS